MNHGAVAIAGIGMTPFGRHSPDYSGRDMGVDAARAALADAGLSWQDIDYAVGGSNVSGKPDTTVSSLGLTGIPFVNVRNGCATGTVALTTAAQAIRSGEAETVLVLGFDKHPRGAFGARPADYGHGDWYGQSGLMVTTQFFAMKARRYLDAHGLPDEVLGEVAAKAFRCGAANPDAWRRTEFTPDEIMAARVINPPLTQYMLCSPAEGAAAVVLTSADRAADLTDRPVTLAAATMRTRRFGSFEVFASWLPPGADASPTVDAARATFAKAGVTPRDVDVAQLQDTDAGAEIIHMAETGLCEHGQQRELLDAGATSPEGTLPINTDGGCLANGEPVGASGLRQVHEVVRQLRGTAGTRQIAGEPRVGFTHVYGAPGIAACTIITR
ncbi:acetyl-CoA acetyltransferase [Prauserella sp. PE36]|uniref:Thiolase family protein n=1 Tax=Prauserella endophytica TaxID=1592324 RepID=A0ABY2S6Q3_9PSEU|nr:MULTISPECIES: thiolase family protein [Prauserella]RBM21809.1 acetyl-CoA acetyltransferase [Prauserella sp. PE36]TKG70979.1 thiolase family protein [Prauserella endophytica]